MPINDARDADMGDETGNNSHPISTHRPRIVVSLYDQLHRYALSNPFAPAIMPCTGLPINYQELFEFVTTIMTQLREAGIGARDRIAIVFPNGPEMATAVTTIASLSVCVPLNPDLAEEDWKRYFEQLKIDALIWQAGPNTTARQAASSLGLRLIALEPDENRPGLFSLHIEKAGSASQDGIPGLFDTTFILPTSGTTSLPKAVPLSHSNISHSAWNTIAALELLQTDRLLAVLPLYHAVGLIAGLMTTLTAGASVICPGQFEVEKFYASLAEHRPTWYTAVPTIHGAIIAAGPDYQDIINNHSLRLVRSSGASLPPPRFTELEQLFGVPVIEAYGMTESASQITSNPLPPRKRKIGSVGPAAGPEIKIVDDQGKQVAQGETGEIAIRGPILTTGYDGDDDNEADKAVGDDWFRTGDLGYMDPDEYLFVVGRSKELIIRGGENISPRKIDEVLLDHPDVLEAVAYSVPHPRLGEDIAAAVVLRPGASASNLELRNFALDSKKLRLSEVPRFVKIIAEIPKSGTGKIQRNRILEELRSTPDLGRVDEISSNIMATKSVIEHRLTEAWSEEFATQDIGRNDDFFALGGDSLMAIRIGIRARELFNFEVTLRMLFEQPTIAELADYISRRTPELTEEITGHSDKFYPAPASASQSLMFSQHQLNDGYPIFNLVLSFRLKGKLDRKALKNSIDTVIQRHEVLRGTFGWSHGECSFHVPQDGSWNGVNTIEDWKVLGETGGHAFARSVCDDEAWTRFDLEQKPAIRFRLLELTEDVSVLVIATHHIISDSWSTDILLREISANYAQQAHNWISSAAVRDVDFSDFAVFQNNWSTGANAEAQLDYWAKNLHGAQGVFPQGKTPSRQSSLKAGRSPVAIDEQLLQKARDLAKQEETTLFVLFLTTYKLLLFSKFDVEDICVATPAANRSWKNAEEIVGLVENTVVVRTAIDSNKTFRDLLANVRSNVLNAQVHQEYPFETLMQELARRGAENRVPPVDMFFSLTSKIGETLTLPEVEIQVFGEIGMYAQPVIPVNQASFMLMLNETHDGICGSLAFDETEFDDNFIAALISDFQLLLEYVINTPQQTLEHMATGVKQLYSLASAPSAENSQPRSRS